MDEYLPNELRMSQRHHRTETMMGFVLGAAVGAGLALLFAPAPGSETRRKLGDGARRIGSEARHKLDGLRHQAHDVVEDVKGSVERGIAEAKSAMAAGAEPRSGTDAPTPGVSGTGSTRSRI